VVDVREELSTRGIVGVSRVFSDQTLKHINDRLDEHFAQRKHEARGYAWPEDLEALGLLDVILNDEVISLFFQVMDDPVIFHLLVNEIAAGQSKPHVFGSDLLGWHRDSDAVYDPRKPTHVSFFIYLSDVLGAEDAPFEIIPGSGASDLKRGLPAVSMTGEAGTAFLWHRRFLHRAAPNRSPRRRRLLKFSIQTNEYKSVNLDLPFVRGVAERMRERDEVRRLLFGAYQGRQAPRMGPFRPAFGCYTVKPTIEVDIKRISFIKYDVMTFLRRVRRFLRRPGGARASAERSGAVY
jgi:Phytanoyl-CoA dioxygenase (PhyH)